MSNDFAKSFVLDKKEGYLDECKSSEGFSFNFIIDR